MAADRDEPVSSDELIRRARKAQESGSSSPPIGEAAGESSQGFESTKPTAPSKAETHDPAGDCYPTPQPVPVTQRDHKAGMVTREKRTLTKPDGVLANALDPRDQRSDQLAHIAGYALPDWQLGFTQRVRSISRLGPSGAQTDFRSALRSGRLAVREFHLGDKRGTFARNDDRTVVSICGARGKGL